MIHRIENPLVSVIIPTYNRGWCLNEAIDSVFSQTYERYELIVVDDGSEDDTGKRLSRYQDITVITQHNRGVSAARNRGIASSKGELIAFLDSDDLWLPEKLSVQVAFFQANPEALVCQTQETWIRNGRRIHPKNRHQKQSGNFFERSLGLCLVSPSAVMIRKRLFETVGVFDENLPACEDYDLWLRVGVSIPIFLIDEPLGHQKRRARRSTVIQYRFGQISHSIDQTSCWKAAPFPMIKKQRRWLCCKTSVKYMPPDVKNGGNWKKWPIIMIWRGRYEGRRQADATYLAG